MGFIERRCGVKDKLFITKADLALLIGDLKKACDEFIAPRREHLDDVVFGNTKADGAELLDYEGNSVISPRAFLLPQTEELFEIKSAKGNDLAPIEDERRRVFYGVRPCDITALKLMRKFFLENFEDLPYKKKLENSIFIALACAKQCNAKSFCYEMGAGPIAEGDFDLGLIPISRGFMAESGSKKGDELIKNNKKLFTKATPQDEKEAKGITDAFKERAKKRIDYEKLFKIMKEDKVSGAIWDDIGLRCVRCSGCITLCPTCSCFSVADRMNPALSMNSVSGSRKGGVKGDSGVRLRYCDGCPYAGFSRMAGGATPFPLHKDHIRRFFEHKLNVDVERYGRPSCVGCGR